nr:unnamed protein product [Digitaria exilis]
MKAWEVMRERAYAFDLVLTEVVMPTLSGIQLLARIVAADECKNIPVIMMSSQDSIGTVLKCMQKGAVDFLVKPVRKNELRNLWQHVWRRHAMNSQTNGSENNAASNHISANVANGSKAGENSDEESDAQSFGSKREAEIQSVQKLPDIHVDQGAGPSRKMNKSFDGVNTKLHASKDADAAPSGSEKNVRSKGLNGITSAKVAEQIMDNALRIADAIYYPQAPLMHCDSAAIQHASAQSNYHENPTKPSQVDEHKQLEENQQLHHSRQILRESGEPIDLVRAHVEHINQSASCSQDIRKGSGCTGSGETGINTNTVVALESGNESGVQNCYNNGLDSDRSRREVALMKFRMKRKDRCFEKKVRYHSRKKLAEQRPRVKGQFVSQKVKSATTTDAETDS